MKRNTEPTLEGGFTRFEYITNEGRRIVLYGKFDLSIQDERRTIKVFGDKEPKLFGKE